MKTYNGPSCPKNLPTVSLATLKLLQRSDMHLQLNSEPESLAVQSKVVEVISLEQPDAHSPLDSTAETLHGQCCVRGKFSTTEVS
uniref:Uncharacterized protein n=1 Tax=Angiostrongylus cantonensis TaxID=6313 RepID=A0A0K0DLF8_ANGCA